MKYYYVLLILWFVFSLCSCTGGSSVFSSIIPPTQENQKVLIPPDSVTGEEQYSIANTVDDNTNLLLVSQSLNTAYFMPRAEYAIVQLQDTVYQPLEIVSGCIYVSHSAFPLEVYSCDDDQCVQRESIGHMISAAHYTVLGWSDSTESMSVRMSLDTPVCSQ